MFPGHAENQFYPEDIEVSVRVCVSVCVYVCPLCLIFVHHSVPPKKLLGSGGSTPYTPFCLICTISSELPCIFDLYPF